MIADSYTAAGGQLEAFISGTSDEQPDRKGDGPFIDGDYWEVDFRNADKE